MPLLRGRVARPRVVVEPRGERLRVELRRRRPLPPAPPVRPGHRPPLRPLVPRHPRPDPRQRRPQERGGVLVPCAVPAAAGAEGAARQRGEREEERRRVGRRRPLDDKGVRDPRLRLVS